MHFGTVTLEIVWIIYNIEIIYLLETSGQESHWSGILRVEGEKKVLFTKVGSVRLGKIWKWIRFQGHVRGQEFYSLVDWM